MIIALDGPSGVGKGTLAQALAKRYRLAFLDTGLLYRQCALWIIENHKDPACEKDAFESVSHLNMNQMAHPRIRTEEVGSTASKLAVHKSVRDALLDYQRNYARISRPELHGAILDGRDIGTVVLPDADIKIYLTAHTEVRAERRFEELKMRGIQTTFDQVMEEVKARDRRDQSRRNSPLCPAPDAFILDTSLLSREEVLEQAISHIEKNIGTEYS